MEYNLNESFLKAVQENNTDEVLILINSGKISISYADKDGHNALHLASMNGQIEIVEMLLKIDSNNLINSKSNSKKTALHLACEYDNLAIVEILINYGADINLQDSLNMTPMHISVERNYVNVIKYLCKSNKSINLNLCDKFNRTCLKIAKANKNLELINIIEEYQLEKLKSNLNIESGLADFYKKKSFARPVNKATKQTISNLCFKKVNQLECSSTDDEENDTYKKKRLSMSPMNLVDESLDWIKNKSVSDLSKFELSLTEAGKLTLEYLNKNDPIQDEQRLLMKLISDLEKNEENQNQNKNNIHNDDLFEEFLFP